MTSESLRSQVEKLQGEMKQLAKTTKNSTILYTATARVNILEQVLTLIDEKAKTIHGDSEYTDDEYGNQYHYIRLDRLSEILGIDCELRDVGLVGQKELGEKERCWYSACDETKDIQQFYSYEEGYVRLCKKHRELNEGKTGYTKKAKA